MGDSSSGGGPKYPNVEWNSGSQPSVHYVPTDIIKNNFPTVMKTEPVFQDIYIFTFMFSIILTIKTFWM